MLEVEKIKQQLNIIEIAQFYGLEPVRKGNVYIAKNNPIRDDGKNSSFTLYPNTNSFHDFGGNNEAGDVIKLIQILENCEFKDAINIINEKYLNNYVPPKINKQEEKQKLTHEQVNQMFNSFKPIDLTVKIQQEHLKTIIPNWLINEANEDDIAYFHNIGRWCPQEHSMLFKLPNQEGKYLTYKFRYKKFDDGVRKWVALYNSRADYLYCNLKHKTNYVLVLEGARDFLSASLCGYDVIAIPRAKYDSIDSLITNDKTYIFIDDNDENSYMKPLYEKSKCTKLYFNHKEWEKYTWTKCKDFSDFLYCFDNLEGFKTTFEQFIDESLNLDWQDRLLQITQPVTLKEIEAAENQDFLYDELIIKQNVTTLVSPPNTGKSAFVFGLSSALLKNKKIDNVYFLDPDSNISYVKQSVEKMFNKFNKKFMYYNGYKNSVQDMIKLLDTMTTLPKGKGKKSLIICDGLQFFAKGTISDDTSSKDFLQLLKEVRDKFGATIVLLHHTKKDKDDKGNFNYIGSQFIETASDNMLILSPKGRDLISIFVKKSRSDKKDNVYDISMDFKEKEILDVRFIKNVANENIEDEEKEDNDDVLESDVVDFLRGKPWTTRTIINKHFKATRKDRPSEEKRKEQIYNILVNSNLIQWNGENKNNAKYKLNDASPVEVIEYNEQELNDIFGGY